MRFGEHIRFDRIRQTGRGNLGNRRNGKIGGSHTQVLLLPPGIYIKGSAVVRQVFKIDKACLAEITVRLTEQHELFYVHCNFRKTNKMNLRNYLFSTTRR